MKWLELLFEILKITVPALIVFLTVYFVMKQFMMQEYQMRVLKMRESRQQDVLPIRMQAYERLTLLCERIMIPSLIFRLRMQGMTANDLQTALLVAIHHEFEHNMTQQVYVSADLWQIIKLARNDAMRTISETAFQLEPNASGLEYSNRLLDYINSVEETALDKALLAIKREASLLL